MDEINSDLLTSSETLTISDILNEPIATTSVILNKTNTTSLTDVSSLSFLHADNIVDKNQSINYNSSKGLSFVQVEREQQCIYDDGNNVLAEKSSKLYYNPYSRTCSCPSSTCYSCTCTKAKRQKNQKTSHSSSKRPSSISSYSSQSLRLRQTSSFDYYQRINANNRSKHYSSPLLRQIDSSYTLLSSHFKKLKKNEDSSRNKINHQKPHLYNGTIYCLNFIYDFFFKLIWQSLMFTNEIDMKQQRNNSADINNSKTSKAKLEQHYRKLPRCFSFLDYDNHYRSTKRLQKELFEHYLPRCDDTFYYHAKQHPQQHLPKSNSHYTTDGQNCDRPLFDKTRVTVRSVSKQRIYTLPQQQSLHIQKIQFIQNCVGSTNTHVTVIPANHHTQKSTSSCNQDTPKPDSETVQLDLDQLITTVDEQIPQHHSREQFYSNTLKLPEQTTDDLCRIIHEPLVFMERPMFRSHGVPMCYPSIPRTPSHFYCPIPCGKDFPASEIPQKSDHCSPTSLEKQIQQHSTTDVSGTHAKSEHNIYNIDAVIGSSTGLESSVPPVLDLDPSQNSIDGIILQKSYRLSKANNRTPLLNANDFDPLLPRVEFQKGLTSKTSNNPTNIVDNPSTVYNRYLSRPISLPVSPKRLTSYSSQEPRRTEYYHDDIIPTVSLNGQTIHQQNFISSVRQTTLPPRSSQVDTYALKLIGKMALSPLKNSLIYRNTIYPTLSSQKSSTIEQDYITETKVNTTILKSSKTTANSRFSPPISPIQLQTPSKSSPDESNILSFSNNAQSFHNDNKKQENYVVKDTVNKTRPLSFLNDSNENSSNRKLTKIKSRKCEQSNQRTIDLSSQHISKRNSNKKLLDDHPSIYADVPIMIISNTNNHPIKQIQISNKYLSIKQLLNESLEEYQDDGNIDKTNHKPLSDTSNVSRTISMITQDTDELKRSTQRSNKIPLCEQLCEKLDLNDLTDVETVLKVLEKNAPNVLKLPLSHHLNFTLEGHDAVHVCTDSSVQILTEDAKVDKTFVHVDNLNYTNSAAHTNTNDETNQKYVTRNVD
ncbi:unnamed protein product [Didymodactylos carnosus]|uniref:Uncharacterized protein n=1 Tax=Didymodactylos carnosus TaxID=1234261 RepID=A0A813XBG0_9BILA|nr:unnamed protein product [Didymodactylos carnosus]CAF0868180.1 unnamed protein product [Didymodactylos carnosus]CAF3581373.1 unnamed protein product [Didymodactylos carnosus]CAF3655632.1 unnamed protein product [Didymodactylos carnosus]